MPNLIKAILLFCTSQLLYAKTHLIGYPEINNLNLPKLEDTLPSLDKAPPISLVIINRVFSEIHPLGEKINRYQQETKLHHGGSFVRVSTIEIGYGTQLSATMNHKQLPINSIIQTLPLCKDFSGNIHYCRKNELIVGFERYWDVSTDKQGQFFYQLISINFPYNIESTFININ